jgi:plasmid stabilization system protein ParE
VAYRRSAAGAASALTLVDELEACLRSISDAPAIGSRRIGQLLGVRELQWKRVGKTKLWFWYAEEATHVDVIRLVSTDQLPRQAMLPDDLR